MNNTIGRLGESLEMQIPLKKLNIIEIVKKWEILRIYFNTILALTIVIGSFSIWQKIPDHQLFLIENIVSFVIANMLYFLGPLAEIGFSFFGSSFSRHRSFVWFSGTFFSLIVTIYSIKMVYDKYN